MPLTSCASRWNTLCSSVRSALRGIKPEENKSGNVTQYNNALFTDELVSWLRFNKPEALHDLDGLYSVCTGNLNVGQRFAISGGASRQSDSDMANVRSSSGLIVIATAQDEIFIGSKVGVWRSDFA